MKHPFIIYAQGLGIYLLLTIPAITLPPMYFISAWYAFTSGFIAMIIFAAIFYILHVTKPSPIVIMGVLYTGAVVAVMIAFKILLLVAMPERWFWLMDFDTIFPAVAIFSGWIALAINTTKVKTHFYNPLENELETIFLNQ